MRRAVTTIVFCGLAAHVALGAGIGCSGSELLGPEPPSADAGSDSGLVIECSPELGLLQAETILATDHPCREWVRRNVGRVAKIDGLGSASLWTVATGARTGLLTTATHVMSECKSERAPRDESGNCPETLQPPRNGALRLRFTEPSGIYTGVWSAMFSLFNSGVPSAELSTITTIQPRHDLSVYVVDGLTYPPWDSFKQPEQPSAEPLQVFDPEQQLSTPPTWAEATPGNTLLVMGYPLDPANQQPDLTFSVARVLSPAEIEQAFERLAAEKDEEATLPYDEEAEFFLEGSSVIGMSGAGLFDREGRQVGILVRGSDVQSGKLQILRAVRMSFVVARMQAARERLTEAEREPIDPYLERQ